jgi:tetratricopeptide (TPR) repeat protein
VDVARARFYALARSPSPYALSLRDAGVYLLANRAPTSALDEENIGFALLTLNQPAVALGPWRQAARLAPTDGSARAYYGWTLWLLGQRAAARPEIAAGLRYGSALPFAYYAAGQVALADGAFAVALARFQTGLEIDPKNAALWSAAGDAALAQADYVTAGLSFGNAAQFSTDPAFTIALLNFYLDHGIGVGDGQALQLAFAAVRRFPTSEPLVFLEGRMYDSIGQQTQAYYAFQQANALDPTDPGPWYYLGRYAAANGEVIAAVVDLRTALALQPAGAYAAQARHTLSNFHQYAL